MSHTATQKPLSASLIIIDRLRIASYSSLTRWYAWGLPGKLPNLLRKNSTQGCLGSAFQLDSRRKAGISLKLGDGLSLKYHLY